MKNNIKYIKIIVFFLIVFNQITSAQEKLNQISGVVLDKTNLLPIPDANINIKNSSISVVTDVEGKFVITSNHEFPLTLVISNTNYESKQVELISYQNNLQIELVSKETK